MVLGFKHLGGRLCQLLFRDSNDALRAASSFLVAIAVVATALQIMLVAWKIPVQLFRGLAWALAGLGLVEIWSICRAGIFPSWKRVPGFLSELRFIERATACLLLSVCACLALLALSPPTDADSLDYHLGVPLEFLRRGTAYPRYDWFHARLIGSGEVLNMLGLAGGTDILNATLSVAALFALLMAVISRLETGRDRIFALGSLISCPFLLFLVPNQKPFLLPVAANTLALLLLSERFRSLDGRSIMLAFGCCFFAMSCKYSFLLSGSVVLFFGMVAAYISRRAVVAITLALVFYLTMVFPMELQKFLFYGDPISPMLEVFKEHGDAGLTRFAQYVRYYSMSTLSFPLGIILPDTVGRLSSVLGLGVLSCCVVLFNARRSIIMVTAAFAAITVSYCAGARSAGYYLEPCMWFCIAAASAPWSKRKSVMHWLLVGQAAVMLLFSGFGVAKLFPGAVTPALREHVMNENAHQYAMMRWLDRMLPEHAVVLSTLRSHALMPRPFAAKDIVTWTDWTSQREREKSLSILKSHKLDTLVAEPAAAGELADRIEARCRETVAMSESLPLGTRNPWNRRDSTKLAVYGTCFAGISPRYTDYVVNR